MRFENQVVVVTGGASGIGRATSRAFAAEGAAVVVADRQAAQAELVADEIKAAGGRVIAHEINVTDYAAVQAMVERTVSEFGRLDVIVTCAGIASTAPVLEHRESQWRRVIDVNLTGVFFCAQAAARQMAEQGYGRIINIASINGFRGIENLVSYNAAKAGVVSLTQTFAVELAPHGINVNAIAPAQIETPMLATVDEDARRRRMERIPLDRFGQPEEIARAALFLASEDAAFITGHTLPVDGGYLAGGLWSRRPAGG